VPAAGHFGRRLASGEERIAVNAYF